MVGELLRFARGQEPAYAARCRDLWLTLPGAYRKAAKAISGDLVSYSESDKVERVYGTDE